ncbi:MAG: hypothetical protein AAFV86_02575 [Pseudomonadota bacterium]
MSVLAASYQPVPPGTVLHATAVVMGRGPLARGLLIIGPSGSGKTRLALEILALGHGLDTALVGDDRVVIDIAPSAGAAPQMRPVPALAGLIEIRGAGVMRHPYRAAAPCWMAIDLTVAEDGAAQAGKTAVTGRRATPARWLPLAGIAVPCLEAGPGLHAAALIAILRTGRLPDAEFAPAPSGTAVPGGDTGHHPVREAEEPAPLDVVDRAHGAGGRR